MADPVAGGLARSGAARWAEAAENSAYPLFSQKKTTGSAHTAARLTASWKAPWATAPSPKKATATVPSDRNWAAVAAPAAIGSPAATIPLAPKMPSAGSAMCIDPPRPRLVPPSLPISSANMP